MRDALLAKAEHLHQVRRLVPVALVPAVVRRRLDQVWTDADFRAQAEGQMRYLLEHTERADEVAELARGYAEQMLLRSYLRWHPNAITRQRVRGIEWLTTRRDPDRGVVLSFMHHNRYDGMFGSLARLGPLIHTVAAPEMVAPDAPISFRQHIHVVRRGSVTVPSSGGTEALVALLGEGVILGIASDFPGRTPVTFLGRRVLGSFGAARLATLTNSPVVLVTVHRDAEGSYLQVEPPIEPADFDDPGPLLDEILRRHEGPVLAWPEAFESPVARFGALDG